MGAVYDVELNLMYTDEKSASLALSKYLDKCIESGVKFATPKDTSTIDSMMEMFLAEQQGGFDATVDGEFEAYTSGFTATYSWSEILDDMFDTLLPYLHDGSYYYQSCDEDYDEYVVKNRKKLLTRSSWRKMSETVIRLSNLSKTMDYAWETMDFSVYDKKSKKIDFTLMELSRQLRSGLLDCVWFDNSYEKVVWTRSLKKKDAIQITSFSQKYKTPNGDEQASDYKELLEITKRSGIYNGIELHTLTV